MHSAIASNLNESAKTEVRMNAQSFLCILDNACTTEQLGYSHEID